MSTTTCLYKQTFLKPFLRNCWEDYVADFVTSLLEEEQNSEKFKILYSELGWGRLFLLTESSRNDRKVFSVCGITTHKLQKVRNDKFLRSIMQNLNEKIHEEEKGLLEECDEDPFYNM